MCSIGAGVIFHAKWEKLGDSRETNHPFAIENFVQQLLPEFTAHHCQIFASVTRQANVSVVLEASSPQFSSKCASAASFIAHQINFPSLHLLKSTIVSYFDSAYVQENQMRHFTGGTNQDAVTKAVDVSNITLFGTPKDSAKSSSTAISIVTITLMTVGATLAI